jgi:IS30 family transposase
MPHCHLTLCEREVISQMLYSGASLSAIGKTLGRHRGTISREINRNTQPGLDGYYAQQANWMAEQRRDLSKERFAQHDHRVWRYVKKQLREGWSPEQIAGRLRDDFADDASMRISHETVYAWIRRDKRDGGDWWKCLRQSHRKRRKRYGSGRQRRQIKDRIGIENRPAVVEQRLRLGDWEIAPGITRLRSKAKGSRATWSRTWIGKAVMCWRPGSTTSVLRRSTKGRSVRFAEFPDICATR